ncbi:MAG: fasciclin domain-containing protein, partial [Prolixibacteraceae bacterium]|nr:fasciclin domain-containing protein [Prolixibacteraceae bacterium]
MKEKYNIINLKSSWYNSLFFNRAWLFVLIVCTVIFSACDSDDVGDNYYTFTGETMGQYIEARPELYSEFSQMLDTTGVKSLLNAYGKYTCFLPTNNAVNSYYEQAGIVGMHEMSMDSIKKIVFNHIIKDFVLDTEYFVDGFLSNLTMSGRYLRISFDMSGSKMAYRVNNSSLISEANQMVHNGVLHEIDNVLSPTENTLIEAIAENKKFSLFHRALIVTGLDKELLPIKDESYQPSDLFLEIAGDGRQQTSIESLIRVPKERKYGFTAFMESNETFQMHGITSIETMADYAKSVYDVIYPEDAGIDDYTNRKNSLNRFIAYHLVNKKMPVYYIIEAFDNTGQDYDTKGETHSVKTVDMFEYIEPMCPNTLIEVRTLRSTNEYNVFNMISETGEAIRLTNDYDNDALNGVYHEIDGILAYTYKVERELSSKRLRMDAASFFPELTNNNIRVGSASKDYPSERWSFPPGFLERVDASETSVFSYFNADDRFLDYQGDEIFVPRSLYEFTLTTPPIPAGTY